VSSLTGGVHPDRLGIDFGSSNTVAMLRWPNGRSARHARGVRGARTPATGTDHRRHSRNDPTGGARRVSGRRAAARRRIEPDPVGCYVAASTVRHRADCHGAPGDRCCRGRRARHLKAAGEPTCPGQAARRRQTRYQPTTTHGQKTLTAPTSYRRPLRWRSTTQVTAAATTSAPSTITTGTAGKCPPGDG
jgi:hypothetical protein